MKKNLFFRLCLMMAVALFIYACRTDHLPENETTYNNSSKFQLTSKTISLNDSKHKALLSSELEKAKTEIKIYAKKQEYGKSVNFGDDIIIDTENVIYIENGSNYYTYTFNIKREGAPEDAPLENLVLSPLTDGTYKEFIVSYNLTPQEKQTIMSGGFLDTKDKSTITELGTGVYPGLLSKDQNCYWEPITIDIPCASPDDLHMPGQACDLTGANGPQKMTVFLFICKGGDPVGGGWEYGGSGSNGNGGGASGNEDPYEGNYNEAPCSPNGVLTGPQIPNDNTGTGLCGGGVPTLPNLPDPEEDPCEKVKAKLADQRIKNQFNALNTQQNFDSDHEVGFYEKTTKVNNSNVQSYVPINGTPCSDFIDLPSDTTGITGFGHTHNKYDCSGKENILVPSPTDIMIFMYTLVKQSKNFYGNYSNAFFFTVTSGGSYMFQYTGTLPPQNLAFNINSLKNNYTKVFRDLKNEDPSMSQDRAEKVFLKFMKEKVNIEGLETYKVTADLAEKIEYDPSTKTVITTPCP